MTSPSLNQETRTAGIPRMPAFFGRQGGPRQRVTDLSHHSNADGHTSTTWLAVEADPDRLAALIPRGFELLEPLLIIEGASLRELPWLAGRGYELVSVAIPVNFVEGRRPVRGRLELVTWENLADPIVSGREELGFNKVYADDITFRRDESTGASAWSVGWGGTRFLEFGVTDLTSNHSDPTPIWRSGPTFHYRVLARTGEWGALEVEQVTANTEAPTEMRLLTTEVGRGSVQFREATFEQLPTLSHIVNALSAAARSSVVAAGHSDLRGWSDLRDMRIVANWPVAPAVVHDLAD